MVKEIDYQVFVIIFEAVGDCGLRESLQARVAGIAAPSEGLKEFKSS